MEGYAYEEGKEVAEIMREKKVRNMKEEKEGMEV